jgi:hypothetical protein
MRRADTSSALATALPLAPPTLRRFRAAIEEPDGLPQVPAALLTLLLKLGQAMAA